ncbi:succinate dehydrogenase assembly factor 2 [Thetidibacter halocola]|uniref:FAD assembly factor SdhE n=1 Tax=Thetidibacter halocola TaxID=2827239 RepID=A0A8J7WDL9_9RHOB|nr:succinate dehydrogenase assembly factor 2 [Thetidibacter halocola]MBS0124812.1 succinate dehydrogenase assembly factor 2 [Thetidibacter halocola]
MEDRETRLKRLAMRSMRRGTKEMDILLIRYSEARLPDMTGQELDAYEALLAENDQDLYQWISGQAPAPDTHAPLVADIARIAANG